MASSTARRTCRASTCSHGVADGRPTESMLARVRASRPSHLSCCPRLGSLGVRCSAWARAAASASGRARHDTLRSAARTAGWPDGYSIPTRASIAARMASGPPAAQSAHRCHSDELGVLSWKGPGETPMPHSGHRRTGVVGALLVALVVLVLTRGLLAGGGQRCRRAAGVRGGARGGGGDPCACQAANSARARLPHARARPWARMPKPRGITETGPWRQWSQHLPASASIGSWWMRARARATRRARAHTSMPVPQVQHRSGGGVGVGVTAVLLSVVGVLRGTSG